MSEIQLKATNVEDKPVRIGDLPIVKTNILENAGQMDKGVVGGYNGAFPLTAASEGGIYLLPSTGKFYVCETAYNGAQISAPNSNFVELSVWKNHDRLTNLFEVKSSSFGHSFKVGKLIISFGIIKSAPAGYIINFPISYTNIPMVQIGTETQVDFSLSINTNPVDNITINNFTVAQNYHAPIDIHWLAIGY